MSCDRSTWPRCLAWHGWLPALSPRRFGSPWAVATTDWIDAALETALGVYPVHPGEVWKPDWDPDDISDLADGVPDHPNIWTDASRDEDLDAMVGSAGAGAYVKEVPWVFDGGAWGLAQDLHLTPVGTVCRGPGLGSLSLSAVLKAKLLPRVLVRSLCDNNGPHALAKCEMRCCGSGAVRCSPQGYSCGVSLESEPSLPNMTQVVATMAARRFPTPTLETGCVSPASQLVNSNSSLVSSVQAAFDFMAWTLPWVLGLKFEGLLDVFLQSHVEGHSWSFSSLHCCLLLVSMGGMPGVLLLWHTPMTFQSSPVLAAMLCPDLLLVVLLSPWSTGLESDFVPRLLFLLDLVKDARLKGGNKEGRITAVSSRRLLPLLCDPYPQVCLLLELGLSSIQEDRLVERFLLPIAAGLCAAALLERLSTSAAAAGTEAALVVVGVPEFLRLSAAACEYAFSLSCDFWFDAEVKAVFVALAAAVGGCVVFVGSAGGLSQAGCSCIGSREWNSGGTRVRLRSHS